MSILSRMSRLAEEYRLLLKRLGDTGAAAGRSCGWRARTTEAIAGKPPVSAASRRLLVKPALIRAHSRLPAGLNVYLLSGLVKRPVSSNVDIDAEEGPYDRHQRRAVCSPRQTHWQSRWQALPSPAYQPSLRLIVLVLVIGSGLGWIINRAAVQRDAVAVIERNGGSVKYQWDWMDEGPNCSGKPRWARRLLDYIGPNYLAPYLRSQT